MGVRSRPRPATRRESERRTQTIILASVVVILVLLAGIGAYGYYENNVRPKTEPIIRVGDRSFDMGYMERRVRYTVRNADPAGDVILYNAEVAAFTALDNVEKQELDRQGAPALGLSVSEEEIDAEIRLRLRVPDTSDPNVFADAYRNAVRDSGLRPSEYREVAAADLLEDKLRQHFRDQIPAATEQIRMRTIRVKTQQEADQVLQRLQAGEDFAALVQELSLDTTTKNKGGEMDWMPRGALAPAVESAVFVLEVGQTSEPVYLQDTGTFWIYQVLEKAASKEVTSGQSTQIENESYSNWQDQVRQQVEVVTYLDQEGFQHFVDIAKEEGAGVSGG